MQLIYDAGRQARKVRWVLFLSAVIACATIWASIAVYNTFGLNPSDRQGLVALISAVGLGAFLGMSYYTTIYVVRISYLASQLADDNGGFPVLGNVAERHRLGEVGHRIIYQQHRL